jgi:hypothetical protein
VGPGFVLKRKEHVMTITKQITLALALTLGATIGAATAASAQSAYTSGTIASSEHAGYPAVGGYGSGLYAYAPGHGSANVPVYGYGSDGRTHTLHGRVEAGR